MLSLNYRHVDVFSRELMSGNGLTVFQTKTELPPVLMQAITREMRQFESIFLVTTADPRVVRARVFTMEEELDFAGHPVLGAAAVLHEVVPAHGKVFVVTSEAIFALWGDLFKSALSGADRTFTVLAMQDGEGAKRLGTVEKLAVKMTDGGADRRSVIIAFGGGVVGDVAGRGDGVGGRSAVGGRRVREELSAAGGAVGVDAADEQVGEGVDLGLGDVGVARDVLDAGDSRCGIGEVVDGEEGVGETL